MNRSETIEKLAEALALAQGKILAAPKDKTNPHFRHRYADLASVWDACREPLSSHGLAVAQTTRPLDGGVMLETTLLHTSGQWISGELQLTCDLKNPQAIGSAITYGRRYGLAAIVGVCPEDDDGAAAAAPRSREDFEAKRREVNRSYRPGPAPPPAPEAPASRRAANPDSDRDYDTHSRPAPARAPDSKPLPPEPEEPPLPSPRERAGPSWASFAARVSTEQFDYWQAELAMANVPKAERQRPENQPPNAWALTNHFVSLAIERGKLAPEDVSKNGLADGPRDPTKAKAIMAEIFRRAPRRVAEAVEQYYRGKEALLRLRLGMDDLDGEAEFDQREAEPEKPEPKRHREPGDDDDLGD